MIEAFYELKPDYECEPEWYKLKWRPIWYRTIYLHNFKFKRWDKWGARTYRSDWNNGWGRYCKVLYIQLSLGKICDLMFWIRWDFSVHKDGPMDVSEKRPIDIPKGLRDAEKD